MAAIVQLASVGYALSGCILGLGLFFVLARLDNSLDVFARTYLRFSTRLLLTLMAAAAISLGKTSAQSTTSLLLRLHKPAILMAAMLVFVCTVKELIVDDPAAAVRLQHAGHLFLRKRLVRRAGGGHSHSYLHYNRHGAGGAAFRRAGARR